MPIVVALVATAGLSACGGEDEDAQAVIDRAFSEPIESADLTLNADLVLEGSEELTEPIRIGLSGPFRSGGVEQIPSFDLDVALQGGDTEVPPLGLVSTGDNVFVEVQGVAYEVGEEVVAAQNEQLAEDAEGAPGLGALGVNPREWIEGAQIEDGEDVAGVPTTHVAASVDIPTLIADLNEAAQQAAGAGGGTAPTLSEEESAQLTEAIENPTFDVFAGEEDGKIRRLAAALPFTVPEDAQADLGGITGGSLSFTLELANVDGDQEIEAPEDARPLADLAEQISGLGGVLGEGSDAPGGALTVPPEGGAPPTPPEEGGTPAPEPGAAAPSTPGGDQLQEFGDCLREADPGDQAALEACNELVAP